ncbi:hypothetical protein ILYODFUR_001161 [Ilyodon furcidens]|uniref:Uncharacterized protein n=1 Tax=Ilyodon furcidens TaxID=33524 RepID=A0ABV0UPI4_9TELE
MLLCFCLKPVRHQRVRSGTGVGLNLTLLDITIHCGIYSFVYLFLVSNISNKADNGQPLGPGYGSTPLRMSDNTCGSSGLCIC